MAESNIPADPSEPNRPVIVQQAVAGVRREPMKATLSAFVVGLVLSVLPVGRIISIFVNLALMLLRPALMIFGAMKVWEEVDRRRKLP
jgi:hypothetical protein